MYQAAITGEIVGCAGSEDQAYELVGGERQEPEGQMRQHLGVPLHPHKAAAKLLLEPGENALVPNGSKPAAQGLDTSSRCCMSL